MHEETVSHVRSFEPKCLVSSKVNTFFSMILSHGAVGSRTLHKTYFLSPKLGEHAVGPALKSANFFKFIIFITQLQAGAVWPEAPASKWCVMVGAVALPSYQLQLAAVVKWRDTGVGPNGLTEGSWSESQRQA